MIILRTISLLLSVITLAISATQLQEPGVIKVPLSKRKPSYSKRQVSNDNVKLNDYQDTVYYFPIKVGGQQFQMQLDTGSLDLWVPGNTCTGPQCRKHNLFNPSSSSTFQTQNQTTSIQYVDGTTISGLIGTDTVTIGSATVKNQMFVIANNIMTDESNPFDGIVGFGPQTNGQLNGPTLFHQLVSQGVVSNPIFGIFLGSQTGGTGSSSELTLGGIDSSKFTGNVVYNKLIPNSDTWNIMLNDLNVDGTSLGFGNRVAAVDTGTSEIVIPQSDLVALNNVIKGQIAQDQSGNTFIEVDCNSNHVISLKFSGATYTISSQNLILMEQAGFKDVCVLSFYSIIDTGGDTQNLWILGDAFLKNVYTVFNISTSSVGFASVGTTSVQVGAGSILRPELFSTSTFALKIILAVNICVIWFILL